MTGSPSAVPRALGRLPLLSHAWPSQTPQVLAFGEDGTLADCLLGAAATEPRLVTRLAKDIRFGEFNVCVDGLRDLPANRASVEAFEQRLAQLRHAYRVCRASLRDKLGLLARRASGDVLAVMIERFVDFHRHLYSHPYDTTLGEYGIGRSRP